MKKHCKGCSNKPHSQDALHGKGIRVFNENKGKNGPWLHCTVCGNEEAGAGPVAVEAPKKGAKVEAAPTEGVKQVAA